MRTRHISVSALLATVAVTATALTGPGAIAATDADDRRAPVTFGAGGWASRVAIEGQLVNSGRTVLSQIGCTRSTRASNDNTASGIEIPTIGSLAEVTTEAFAGRDGSTYTSTGRTTIENVSLLAGDLVVEGISTEVQAFRAAGEFGGSVDVDIAAITFLGDEIEFAGEPQVIDLAGVGTLTLARSNITDDSRRARAAGSAVVLELLDGTVISVGNATATVDERGSNGRFSGGAYGTRSEVEGDVTAGRSAVQPLPCAGTRGKDRSNSTESSDLGELGQASEITSTVNAKQNPLPEATVRNEISDVTLQLVGAELRLEGVVTEVHAVRQEDGTVVTDLGDSGVGSLVVDPVVGDPIVVEIPAPGESIELPLGLGSASFFATRPYRGDKGIALTGVRLELTVQQAVVVIGSARAAIRR